MKAGLAKGAPPPYWNDVEVRETRRTGVDFINVEIKRKYSEECFSTSISRCVIMCYEEKSETIWAWATQRKNICVQLKIHKKIFDEEKLLCKICNKATLECLHICVMQWRYMWNMQVFVQSQVLFWKHRHEVQQSVAKSKDVLEEIHMNKSCI